MKARNNLLAIYGLIVAIVLPVLHIASNFLAHPLITTRGYFFAVAAFLLLVYNSKTSHHSSTKKDHKNNSH